MGLSNFLKRLFSGPSVPLRRPYSDEPKSEYMVVGHGDVHDITKKEIKKALKNNLGILRHIVNIQPKSGANKHYFGIWVSVKMDDTTPSHDLPWQRNEFLMFTNRELNIARDRAKKNPEDIFKKT